jgi:hypothetical protein
VSPRAFLRGPDPTGPDDVARLHLQKVEQFDDGLVWLRYDVEK